MLITSVMNDKLNSMYFSHNTDCIDFGPVYFVICYYAYGRKVVCSFSSKAVKLQLLSSILSQLYVALSEIISEMNKMYRQSMY